MTTRATIAALGYLFVLIAYLKWEKPINRWVGEAKRWAREWL